MYKWADSVMFAADTHVLGPLKNLSDEIFDTFHGHVSSPLFQLMFFSGHLELSQRKIMN